MVTIIENNDSKRDIFSFSSVNGGKSLGVHSLLFLLLWISLISTPDLSITAKTIVTHKAA